jgi:hypothetical protein
MSETVGQISMCEYRAVRNVCNEVRKLTKKRAKAVQSPCEIREKPYFAWTSETEVIS